MVNLIDNYFSEQNIKKNNNLVSDGICTCNSRDYIDFDEFIAILQRKRVLNGDTPSSCDTLLINTSEEHLIFVEFKNMNDLTSPSELSEWWKNKNKSVYLKITDSILSLGYFLQKEESQCFNNFMNMKKSFFYVYKSDTYKSKIKSHLKNKFSRYSFLLQNIHVLEVNNYESFLEHHNL